MGTAGAIGFAATSAGIDETFVVVNGDVHLLINHEGLPLAPIAEHWVLQPDVEYTYLEGTLPFMQVRIAWSP